MTTEFIKVGTEIHTKVRTILIVLYSVMGTKIEVVMEFKVDAEIEKSSTVINAEINVAVNNFSAC